MIAHDETLCGLSIQLQARYGRSEDLELGCLQKTRTQEASDTHGRLADSAYASAIRLSDGSRSSQTDLHDFGISSFSMIRDKCFFRRAHISMSVST